MNNFEEWVSIGYAVSVSTAIEIIDSQRPDLIFLDWSLNGGSAFEIMQKIQSEPSYTPYIIFNTGYQKDNPEIPQEIINNYKVDKYLIKPIWENLRLYLPDYLSEASEKAQKNNNKRNSETWVCDINGVTKKINLKKLICICQHPTHPRHRIFYFTDINSSTVLSMQWNLCIQLMEAHNINYFTTKNRSHIVCKEYIENYERPFVRLKSFPAKIEVVKENIKAFEKWLTNE